MKNTLIKKRNHQRKPNHLGEAGFSLMEMIVVITLIGLLTGTVGVSVDELNDNTRLYNAINRTLSDMRYGQEAAMGNSREVSYRINTSTNGYSLVWNDTGEYLQDPVDGGDLIIQLNTGQFQGVSISSSEIGSNLTITSTGEPMISGSTFSGSRIMMTFNSGDYITIYETGLISLNQASGGNACGAGGCW